MGGRGVLLLGSFLPLSCLFTYTPFYFHVCPQLGTPPPSPLLTQVFPNVGAPPFSSFRFYLSSPL